MNGPRAQSIPQASFAQASYAAACECIAYDHPGTGAPGSALSHALSSSFLMIWWRRIAAQQCPDRQACLTATTIEMCRAGRGPVHTRRVPEVCAAELLLLAVSPHWGRVVETMLAVFSCQGSIVSDSPLTSDCEWLARLECSSSLALPTWSRI